MIETRDHLKAMGQMEPAIATSEGYLVNGNRRLCCLKQLKDPSLNFMRVILLPGTKKSKEIAVDKNPACADFRLDYENGLPASNDEILDLEYLCQYASDPEVSYGRLAEANGYIRRLKNKTLVEIIKMAPANQYLNDTQLKEKTDHIQNNLIRPRKLVDEYLKFHEFPSPKFALREDIGPGFDAFIELAKTFNQLPSQDDSEKEKKRKLKALEKKNILENEIAHFKSFCFYSMRHGITITTDQRQETRKYLKLWRSDKDGIKNMIGNIKGSTTKTKEDNDNWKSANSELIHRTMKNADKKFNINEDKQTPSKRVTMALEYLNIDNLKLENLPIDEYKNIMNAANRIKESANELWNECNDRQKKLDSLDNKKRNKKQ